VNWKGGNKFKDEGERTNSKMKEKGIDLKVEEEIQNKPKG
jgi:hypothetical protein